MEGDAQPDTVSVAFIAEMERLIGTRIRVLRLLTGRPQALLAKEAGISVRALRDLEKGSGANLKTLICVLRALDCDSWLLTLGPGPEVDPVTLFERTVLRSRPKRRGLSQSGETSA